MCPQTNPLKISEGGASLVDWLTAFAGPDGLHVVAGTSRNVPLFLRPPLVWFDPDSFGIVRDLSCASNACSGVRMDTAGQADDGVFAT